MKHLTVEQRYTISVLLKEGKSQKEISRIIEKSESCISREINRNKDAKTGIYKNNLADRKCRERHRKKPKRSWLSDSLKEQIALYLKKKYSPEQIHGRFKLEGKQMVSHECIYQYIWKDKKQGGSLYSYLRTQGQRYRRRGRLTDKRGLITDRKSIDLRPQIVNEKERIGDLEIDLIIGKNHKGVLLTINDRVTKMAKIRLLPSKEAEEVAKGTIDALKDWPFVKTITSDNGKEFALHQTIAKALNIEYYFAKPYHSWERGANENMNGLIRQYAPKKIEFSYLSKKTPQYIEHQLNNRPRKTLGYFTPYEVHLHKINQTEKIAFIT